MLECQRFAKILRGTVSPNDEGVCYVCRMRSNIRAIVREEVTYSPVFQNVAFSYEPLTCRPGERAHCFAKYVFFQWEVHDFIRYLMNDSIFHITSIHVPVFWDQQNLVVVHWTADMDPLEFASKSMNAIDLAIGYKEGLEEPPEDD